MIKTKLIITSLIAQFFVLVILFPSVIQFAHIFEGHDHNYCGVVETHLHEDSTDCDLLKFISTTYHFDEHHIDIIIPIDNYNNQEYYYTYLIKENRSQSNYLRGPPFFQQES
ncbi:hypothetical protein ULMS_18260 [Patiriisocius marinistellae]|uniref:Uncharacterized protein n=1 Tax=Patiriisocius marinistellae TaxID=2494560 RepID=A0A5J4FY81_9FLAO|nr:hypothetical protein [Patiriisocius marinistellae]GEQ86318.1 hypothetical protein ULMS_18260 [Patiriisocius marinistellae]